MPTIPTIDSTAPKEENLQDFKDRIQNQKEFRYNLNDMLEQMKLPAHLRIFKLNLERTLVKMLEQKEGCIDREWLAKKRGYQRLVAFLKQKPKTFMEYMADREALHDKQRNRPKKVVSFDL